MAILKVYKFFLKVVCKTILMAHIVLFQQNVIFLVHNNSLSTLLTLKK